MHSSLVWNVAASLGALVIPAIAQDYGADDSERATLFGHEVAAIGDLDGDGAEDLAVTAPLAWSSAGRSGSVLLLSTQTGKMLGRIDGAASDAAFGWKIQCTSPMRAGRGGTLAIGCSARRGAAEARRESRIYALDSLRLLATIPATVEAA